MVQQRFSCRCCGIWSPKKSLAGFCVSNTEIQPLCIELQIYLEVSNTQRDYCLLGFQEQKKFFIGRNHWRDQTMKMIIKVNIISLLYLETYSQTYILMCAYTYTHYT